MPSRPLLHSVHWPSCAQGTLEAAAQAAAAAAAGGACAVLGCDGRGPQCACNVACNKFGDCCPDFEETCLLLHPPPAAAEGSCKALGCGVQGARVGCSCNAECKAYGDCCGDYDGRVRSGPTN
mmetsp:Transcript_76075/g.246968  ORF Transcript_76075/g.246968 Transcript_76075/m.246968 type:complete len:123 (-) Transcript_76075:282-650(-)